MIWRSKDSFHGVYYPCLEKREEFNQDTIFQFQGRDLISGISIKYYQNTLNVRITEQFIQFVTCGSRYNAISS